MYILIQFNWINGKTVGHMLFELDFIKSSNIVLAF